MEDRLIEVLARIAGIGGVALGVVLLLFREFIRKNIFPNLSRQQAYNILRLFLVLTFAIALAGIGAWIWGPRSIARDAGPKPPDEAFRRVYYEGFDSAPAAGDIWLQGRRSDWEGSFANGVHRLCNATGSETASFTNRLTYVLANERAVDLGNSKVTVRVRIEPPSATHSGAGIRYRASRERPDYLAFVVNAGSGLSLLRRTPETLKVLWSGELPAAARGELVTLKLVGRGGELELYAGEQLVHRARDLDLVTGEPGIMAYSRGCFVFDDFTLYVPTAAGPPG